MIVIMKIVLKLMFIVVAFTLVNTICRVNVPTDQMQQPTELASIK
jgi:hypothetical protein